MALFCNGINFEGYLYDETFEHTLLDPPKKKNKCEIGVSNLDILVIESQKLEEGTS